MHVRHLEGREDVRGIVRVHARAWRAAYDGLLPAESLAKFSVEPTPGEVDRWQEGLTANEAGVLVADDDGVVGFADLRWGDAETKPFVGEHEAGLKAIYVDPDRWGEGAGTALLSAGLDLLPAAVEALRLEAFAANDVGRRFYEARGFEATDRGETELDGRRYETVIYTRRLAGGN